MLTGDEGFDFRASGAAHADTDEAKSGARAEAPAVRRKSRRLCCILIAVLPVGVTPA
jgi:hypothetical protein